MRKKIDFFDGPTDFSLVQGGPLFQLLLRLKLVKPSMDLLTRRMVAISLVSWLPLLFLSILSGSALGGVKVPFLLDIDVHVRFLLSLPLLIAAESVVHRRIKGVIRQFLDRGIVAPEDQPRFEKAIASAMRLRNSMLAEILLVAASLAGGFLIWKQRYALQVPTWFGTPMNGSLEFTPAGYWYFFVSLILLRFMQFRWYFRLFIWYRFLWQVSRQVRLHLNPLHPDKAGGLSFLSGSVFAFAPVLLAHTFWLAGVMSNKIWHEGAMLPQFKMEIAAWMLFLGLLVVTPLFFFITHLTLARQTGLREYGILASRYVKDFHKKWIEGGAAKNEELVGSADIQSLADLSNSYEVVRDMGLVPFTWKMVVRLIIVTALPLFPLLLTMVPIEQIIDRAAGLIF